MAYTNKCDVCGTPCITTELRGNLQTKEIKELCDECLGEVNKIFRAWRDLWWKQEHCWVKRKLRAMHKQKQHPTPSPAWEMKGKQNERTEND